MGEAVLDRRISADEVVVSPYNLQVEHLCTLHKDSGENSMEFFLLDVKPPTEVEENQVRLPQFSGYTADSYLRLSRLAASQSARGLHVKRLGVRSHVLHLGY